MIIALNFKKTKMLLCSMLIFAFALLSIGRLCSSNMIKATASKDEKGFIKWVDFNISYSALEATMNLDIKTYNSENHLNWIELLAYLAHKNGGNFKTYKQKQLDELVNELNNGKTMKELTKDMEFYNYYYDAYSAVLSGFLGEYTIEKPVDKNSDKKEWVTEYGLKVFSPIARYFPYSHYDDFGASRSYGFKRKHLGNDLLGQVGTPIIAVETGKIEAMGWNKYGGWRIGIRSLDGKRYYYYAHLRKNFPYNKSLKEGDIVSAGDVIGYLGRTGYSNSENTNNIDTPHLHFGMELIFDESQKESDNEIWIDVYNIINLLDKNKSEVVKNQETKDYHRIYQLKTDNEIKQKEKQ